MTVISFMQENIMVIVMLIAFTALFSLMWARRDRLDCTDLITAPNGRMSRTAIGQCGGIVVAIWAPVFTTYQGSLDSGVLAVSLTYLGAVGAFTTYMRSKGENTPKQDEPKPPVKKNGR